MLDQYEETIYEKFVHLQLCAGLKHMHSYDPPYAHNDVKSGNVLVTHRKGQPPVAILMDFGSARPARRQIRSRSEALQLQVLFLISKLLIIYYVSCSIKLLKSFTDSLKYLHDEVLVFICIILPYNPLKKKKRYIQAFLCLIKYY